MKDTNTITISHGSSSYELMRELLDAAEAGLVERLESVLTRDPHILHKLSSAPYPTVPLHVASLRGHTDFTRSLLAKNPSLATMFDAERRSALHFAAAGGHLEIVREILERSKDICIERDEDGRIPLHLAAMNDRAEIAKVLIDACPNSIKERVVDQGSTVFHLCAIRNSLNVLKVLVEPADASDEDVIGFTDHDGNTALHLAAMRRHPEIVKYLLSLPGMQPKANSQNAMGWTALDAIVNMPKDFRWLQVHQHMVESGVQRANQAGQSSQSGRSIQSGGTKVSRSHLDTSHHSKDGEWLNRVRGNLMVVATVIAAMSFEAVINPPGGVWEPDIEKADEHCVSNSTLSSLCGTAVKAYKDTLSYEYFAFVVVNTISFISSLSVILLLISGVSPKNRLFVWFLRVMMCIAVTTLGLAYGQALALLIPTDSYSLAKWIQWTLVCWAALVGIVLLLYSLKFVRWVVKTIYRVVKTIYRGLKRVWMAVTGQQSSDGSRIRCLRF